MKLNKYAGGVVVHFIKKKYLVFTVINIILFFVCMVTTDEQVNGQMLHKNSTDWIKNFLSGKNKFDLQKLNLWDYSVLGTVCDMYST